MKKLSVIIVSYNHYEMLKECIESLITYNDIGEELEIIISDNSPSNEIVEKINCEYPFIKTIYNNNIGFGPGNNRGYFLSTGEYLLFLNPDTILVEPIFKFAIDCFENNKNLSLFGIKLLNRDGTSNHSFFSMDNYGLIWTILMKFFYKTDIYIDGKMYIAGADLFVRRTVFENVGKFDENIFMYYEEPDLIKRIKKQSINNTTAYFSYKKMIHLEGATENKDIVAQCNKVARSMDTYKYYCKKWDISFVKNIKKMIQYQKFKRMISGLFRKKEEKALSQKYIDLYNSLL